MMETSSGLSGGISTCPHGHTWYGGGECPTCSPKGQWTFTGEYSVKESANAKLDKIIELLEKLVELAEREWTV